MENKISQFEKYAIDVFPDMNDRILFLDLVGKIHNKEKDDNNPDGQIFVFRCAKGLGGVSTCIKILESIAEGYCNKFPPVTVSGLLQGTNFNAAVTRRAKVLICQNIPEKEINVNHLLSELRRNQILILNFIRSSDLIINNTNSNIYILNFNNRFCSRSTIPKFNKIVDELKNSNVINSLKYKIFVKLNSIKFILLFRNMDIGIRLNNDINCYIVQFLKLNKFTELKEDMMSA